MLGNEIMTGRVILTDASFSQFTVNLLKDTGWYAEVNDDMVSPMIWGKNHGCDFLTATCEELVSNPSFIEYQSKDDEN